MKTNWEFGPAPDFWMEENPPSGSCHFYVIDTEELRYPYPTLYILKLLSSLGVIDYGTIYEQIDCIRIK